MQGQRERTHHLAEQSHARASLSTSSRSRPSALGDQKLPCLPRSGVAQKLLYTRPRRSACSAWAAPPEPRSPPPRCPRAAGEGRSPRATRGPIRLRRRDCARGLAKEAVGDGAAPRLRIPACELKVRAARRRRSGERRAAPGHAAQREEGNRLQREEGGGYGGE